MFNENAAEELLLGRIADVSWVQSGIRTLVIAAITVALIYWLTG